MTKMQLLHRALSERLMATLEQIMEMVGGTVAEYEEETIRARKENEALKRRLRWMEGANSADWTGPSEPVTVFIPDESNPSQQEEGAVNFEFGPESEAFVIKTESTDFPLCGTIPQSANQGSDNAGTSAGVGFGLSESVTWDSAQSYMAPLDFDPTSGPKRVRHCGGQSRRQRMSFACPDCGKVFGGKQRLLIHMRIHSTERPYAYRRRKECFYGEKKKNRKAHRLSQLSTEVVDDLSDDFEQLNRSSASPQPPIVMRRLPEKKKRSKATRLMYYCPYCPGREFSRPCVLAIHMKTHKETTTNAIVEEESKLPKKQGKNDAVKRSKVAVKRAFPCPKCNKDFKCKANLRFHMSSHNSRKALLQNSLETTKPPEETKEGLLFCPYCNKEFARVVWLERHIQVHHRGKKSRTDPFNTFFTCGPRKSKRLLKKLRMLRAKEKAPAESSEPKAKKSKKVKSAVKFRPETEDSEIFTTETQGITVETEESNADPGQSCEESNMVVDGPKVSADEAEEGAVLPKLGTNESECVSEQSNKDASSTGGTSNAELKMLVYKDADDKMPTSLHRNPNPNTTQTLQESPNKELLQKSKTKSHGPLPCPFCGKVFAWEMRLLMHMQIHCGEKPYPYRQRKKQFYGDQKRGKHPNNEELHENNSDESEQSAGEETQNEDKSSHLSSTESAALEDGSGRPSLLPLPFEDLATCSKKIQRTDSKLIGDITSHFRLQPRIVLKPITTEYKHLSLQVLQSACSETSGIDHEKTSCSVLVDEQKKGKIVSSNLCTTPVKGSAPGIQNKLEICCSVIPEDEIVSVVVCSPKCDSQLEENLHNTCGSLGFESSDGQQKKDHGCKLVSETTGRNQESPIIIDDRPKETTGGTNVQNAPSECGRTKCDSDDIHSMKLTLVKETSSSAMQKNTTPICVVLSDSEDENVLSSNGPAASLPSIQNEPLDVKSKPSKKSSNVSNSPAPETDSLNTHDSMCVDSPLKHIDVELVPSESISDDPQTRDQMTSAAIRQMKDNSVNLGEVLSKI